MTPSDIINETPPSPSDRPEILYELAGLVIGQRLWHHQQLLRLRSVFAPNLLPRWRHVAEADNLSQPGEKQVLETGMMVNFLPVPKGQIRYWLKYQGQEVWVVYVLRFGQLSRYQGGSFALLDSRAAGVVPAVPRGAIEVVGDYAVRLNALLALANDKRYLKGEDMADSFHEQLAELSILFNDIASRSFWHYDV